MNQILPDNSDIQASVLNQTILELKKENEKQNKIIKKMCIKLRRQKQENEIMNNETRQQRQEIDQIKQSFEQKLLQLNEQNKELMKQLKYYFELSSADQW